MFDILGVYLVDFKQNIGGELNGLHYAVVLSELSNKDKTLLVAPMTSKKAKAKYRGGFTIDCKKYQTNPSYDKAFIKVRKIREVYKSRFYGKKMYDLDESDKLKLIEKIKEVIKIF